MALGPVEVVVAGFQGNRFNGESVPALESLVQRDIVNVVDGLLILKAAGVLSDEEFAAGKAKLLSG